MIRNVAIGISGGVDSSVSAYLLKQKGFNVIGVFMTNWDSKDELGFCQAEKDREDAMFVCEKLKIPFRDVNFVKEYWNKVFQYTLDAYKKGLTPNPDILCNREIKFNKFAKFCLFQLGVDAFATGHYANSTFGSYLEKRNQSAEPLLLRPKDKIKDQTFWLSQINQEYLGKCMFPLADMNKSEVKILAQQIGLSRIFQKKESMGMCFIGKRKFSEFIDLYVEPNTTGVFRLLDSGKIVGEHRGIHHYTLGQKSRLSFDSKCYYIASMDTQTQEILLVSDKYHPSLFMKSIYTSPPHWITSNPPITTNKSKSSTALLNIQPQNRWISVPGQVRMSDDSSLSIELDSYMRCIVPGQFAVLYDKEDRICFGSAEIIRTTNAYDQGSQGPGYWNSGEWDRGCVYADL